MKRLASAATTAAAMTLVVVAVATAGGGVVDAGVEADYVGGVVRQVDPAGTGWRAGVRPGQTVLSVRAADDLGGWAIETRAGDGVVRLEIEREAELLRSTMPLAVGALVVGAIGAIQLPHRLRRADGLTTLAVFFASLPIGIGGEPTLSSAALGLAAVLPGAWAARWLRIAWPLRIGVVALPVLVVAVWLVARAAGSTWFEPAEQLRLGLSVVGVLMVVTALVGWRDLDLAMLTRPRLIDVVSICTTVALGATLMMLGVPLLVLAAGFVMVVVLYPAFRHGTLRLLDRAFLAEQRERNALAASESERARLARELHDAPLQELAGVIQRLETVPGSEAERRALREVAAQLRGVTTQLHPPVLDDLGLAAAVDFLAERAQRDGDLMIQVEVDDRTTVGGRDRPPAEVELSMFRIMQEALENAVRHARAASIHLSGFVSPTAVELAVVDDGIGLASADEPLRRGRLGLASMRRRAEIIGAQITIGPSANYSGTEVRVRWEADR